MRWSKTLGSWARRNGNTLDFDREANCLKSIDFSAWQTLRKSNHHIRLRMQGWQECRRQFGSSGWLSACAVAHLSRPNFTGDCLYWHMYHRNVRVECARSTHSSIIRPFKCACQRKLPLRRPQPKLLLQGCMPPVTDCWCQTTPASKALSLQKGRDSKESLYHFLQSFYELL